MFIHDFLTNSSKKFADKIAVKHNNKFYSYSFINNTSDFLAKEINCNNFQPQSRILLIGNNTIDYICSYFAILKCGLIVVPLPAGTSEKTIRYVLKDCSPSAIITDSKANLPREIIIENSQNMAFFYTRHDPLCIYGENERYWNLSLENYSYDKNDINNKYSENDIAIIMYTSGTTGTPKGVCLTHKNIVANTQSICKYLEITSNDSIVQILPFYYSYGKSYLHSIIAAGGTLIISEAYHFVNELLDQIESSDCTIFAGVPSNFYTMLQYGNLCKYAFASLRLITQAGGAMAPEKIKQLMLKVPKHVKFCVMYGITEASPRLAYLPPHKLEEKLGSVGIPIPGVVIKILNNALDECCPYVVGDIVAKGDNIMLGYWNNENGTKLVLTRDGYLITGDVGFMDKDGYLYTQSPGELGGYQVEIGR